MHQSIHSISKVNVWTSKDEDKKWITHTLIDKQIDKLNISNKTKDKIKANYKTKNSTSWKAAEKDKN